ncbi:Mucin-4 [Tupaia chinensis]|uniref:Mucin-4 n=1 Tax=Tupaia chinensis TaxID=246437 RepID=L9JKH3_TUPCH|nr:Mucin-4 [Tupaia chinensis]
MDKWEKLRKLFSTKKKKVIIQVESISKACRKDIVSLPLWSLNSFIQHSTLTWPFSSPDKTPITSSSTISSRLPTSSGHNTGVSKETETSAVPSASTKTNDDSSPQTHIVSTSDVATTFMSTQVNDSQGTQNIKSTLSSGTTERPPTESSTTQSNGVSPSSSAILYTSRVLTSSPISVTHEPSTSAVTSSTSGSGFVSLTLMTQIPSSSVSTSGTTSTPEHPSTAQLSTTTSMTKSHHFSIWYQHFVTIHSALTIYCEDCNIRNEHNPGDGQYEKHSITTLNDLPGPHHLYSPHLYEHPLNSFLSVSLFPYGSSVKDLQLIKSTVDFTSPLFKPRIGFPLGSSLRDSLYFTDNGQIIFPDSDYTIFPYPNPPLKGFTGWDPVAVVAPFWDDADFSRGRGTIFYQEYETLYDDYNPLIQQVESFIEKYTNAWSYKARWTLKVTWVNAPAYPAQRSFGTNTYQAILSTDGSRSYALFLYQSGGMQWDVTQHPDGSVLMGFSSGDGYFKNSPLIFQPVREKYRPDQFLNSNSGLRGLQVYTLHRAERPNYRLQCLQWLQGTPWPSWGWNQISCPCSWQQGRWDLRFQPSGWWGVGSRQLCSFSSWRGGVCCSYGPWGELREGWRVQSAWQLDWAHEPQNWCCRWNDKPLFCALYQQRWPRVTCAGYRPPRPAWAFGDPHINTLDGANYTFNGLGDCLLIRGWDGNSSFLLQGRTAQTGSARATNFIAFAAQYSSSSLSPNTVTVQWLLKPEDTVQVLLNNETVTFETNQEDAEGQEVFNSTGVLLTRNGSMVSASFDGTVTISVVALSNILHASTNLPEGYRTRTEGLLGVWNDNPEDDFRMPNGSTIPHGSSEEQLFHYGMTWKINGTSLLGQRSDPLPSNFTPVFFSQLLVNNSLDGDLVSAYQYPPSIHGDGVIEAYMGRAKYVQYTSSSKNVTFTLRSNYTDFKLSENGTLQWTPKSLEPFTLEILARNTKDGLSSVLQPKVVVCTCTVESQCSYNQTSRVGNSSLEVASCLCDGDTYGRSCERSKDLCDEQCYPNVNCIPGVGCEACPLNLTGDGRHCAALDSTSACENQTCPVNHCYNQGHCYISQMLGCQPTCTCPPAFTDTRCFLAGNNFTPTILLESLRIIQLLLSEEENASVAEVNASMVRSVGQTMGSLSSSVQYVWGRNELVAHRLGNLDVQAFLRNSKVELTHSSAKASGRSVHHWKVISEFQYRPRGPVIDFLNNRLLNAVVEAFLPQASRRRWKRSEGPRNNVVFYPISKEDVRDVMALNLSTLKTTFKCSGYKGYRMVYDPQNGFTCISPCSEGYCDHGGQCQHLPDGPSCSCVSFSIYTSWGERCEHLSMKLGAFFGILFGALGALSLLGVVVFVGLRFWGCSGTKYSYPLDSES